MQNKRKNTHNEKRMKAKSKCTVFKWKNHEKMHGIQMKNARTEMK